MLFEARLIQFLQANASTGWITFFTYFTSLASFVGLIFFASIIFCKSKGLSLWFALTFGFTAIFNKFVKYIFKRPRPFVTYESIMNLGNEAGYSMPSSHSALAAMIAVFMCYFAFKFAKYKSTKVLTCIVMILFVAMICLSRMMLGVHYLTDTIAGAAEGVVLGLISIKLWTSLIKRIEIKIKIENLDD